MSIIIINMKFLAVVALLYISSASFFEGEGIVTREEKLYFEFLLAHGRNYPNHEHYNARFNTFKSHLSDPLPTVD